MTESRVIDVKHEAKESQAFRKVLFTAGKSQLVIVALRPGEDIGTEVHQVDQLLYAVKGEGTAEIDGTKRTFAKGGMLCVPACTRHNVINTGNEPMKLFAVYAPPRHEPGTIHRTKCEAREVERRGAGAPA